MLLTPAAEFLLPGLFHVQAVQLVVFLHRAQQAAADSTFGGLGISEWPLQLTPRCSMHIGSPDRGAALAAVAAPRSSHMTFAQSSSIGNKRAFFLLKV